MNKTANKLMFLVVGGASLGKSTSLKYLDDPQSVAYLNCDVKELPFKDNFKVNVNVVNPYDMLNFIDQCEKEASVKTIVIDTITHLMKSFKVLHIDTAEDTRAAWGNQLTFYNKLMLKLKASKKNVVVLGHTVDEHDEDSGLSISKMVLQGAIGKMPISDYTTVVEAIVRPINNNLLEHTNQHMVITDNEDEDGIKYLFVTRRTKLNPATLARSAMDLWDRDELYIDNSIQTIINRLNEYYGKR